MDRKHDIQEQLAFDILQVEQGERKPEMLWIYVKVFRDEGFQIVEGSSVQTDIGVSLCNHETKTMETTSRGVRVQRKIGGGFGILYNRRIRRKEEG